MLRLGTPVCIGRWITNPDKWGGAIELSILSSYFGREVAAFDIQTQRMDVYGQDRGVPCIMALLFMPAIF